MRIPILMAALAAGCAGTQTPGAGGAPDEPTAAEMLQWETPEDQTLVTRISLMLEREDQPSIHSVMNELEHMLPIWWDVQGGPRRVPIERLLTQKVVASFDDVLRMFRSGPHERRLVAAWALGFSRVPDNPLGVASRHTEALQALVKAVPEAPDDVLNNILLGLWRLGDPDTPHELLAEIVLAHHDPGARANASLALSTILTSETAPDVEDALLVALGDKDDKVRLAAARVAMEFPADSLRVRMEDGLLEEKTPLVKAALARALGVARSPTSSLLLLQLLEDPRQIISVSAHEALVRIHGEDAGPTQEDWLELLGQG